MAKFDNSLIYLLTENARQNLREIGRLSKKSSSRVKYSAGVLEKEGILGKTYTIFDYSYFGQLLFRVYFKGGYIGEKDKNRIISVLKKNEYVIAIYELSGEYDLVVEFAAPNPSRFNKELKKITSLKPTLNNYKVILNLVSYIYPRNYLTRSQAIQSIHVEKLIGGDRETELFTPQEMAVVKVLLSDSHLATGALAKLSKMNVKTFKRIVDNLTERRIIQGYKRRLDFHKIGISRSRLFLRVHNMSQEAEAELTKHMLETREVITFNKTVGDWDMEVDLETADREKARKIIHEIREKFVDIVESFNMIEFYDYYKRTFLPSFLFDEKIRQK